MATTDYHLAGYLPLIQKWRWPVAGVTVAACFISILVSLLLPNIYRSTAVFYPTNLIDLETAVNPPFLTKSEKLALSTNSDDADRLIVIGESQPLAQAIIQNFQLTLRYGYAMADTSDTTRQKVLEEFLDNYTITQSDRSAVEVSFYDADKYFAARVANAIMQQIDSINLQLTRENQQKITRTYAQRLHSLETEYQQAQHQLLQARRKYGIFGSMAERESRPEGRYLAERLIQTETDLHQAQATLASLQTRFTANHPKLGELKAHIKGLEAAVRALKSSESGNSINLESYLSGADEVTRLETVFHSRQGEYLKALQAYEDARLALNSKTSSLYVVQKAYPATKKARPIRWLIVLGATVFSFLVAVAAVSILERLRAVQQKHYYA